jgi:hypothetical protein
MISNEYKFLRDHRIGTGIAFIFSDNRSAEDKMILHSERVTDEWEEQRKRRWSETKKPQKMPYEKPEARKICLEDDEALLRLFKQNRGKVHELRTIVIELLKNSQKD